MSTITIDRALLEQTLQALVRTYHYGGVIAADAECITALRAALAQQQANPPGCDHCNHPLYAATKCRVCGRVTEQAEPVEPVAKVELMTTGGNAGLATRIVEIDDHLRERLRPGQLLYTAPPQQAEPAYKTYAIRMHFEWTGDRWLFNDNHIDNGEWCITLGNGGWVIYPKMEQAKPVQEPVAWRYELATTIHENEYGGWEQLITPYKPNAPDGSIRNLTPLYTAPPQRKPLTEEEIPALAEQVLKLSVYYDVWALLGTDGLVALVRAVERAHGIGGNT